MIEVTFNNQTFGVAKLPGKQRVALYKSAHPHREKGFASNPSTVYAYFKSEQQAAEFATFLNNVFECYARGAQPQKLLATSIEFQSEDE